MAGSILKDVDVKAGASALIVLIYPVVGEIISCKKLNSEEVASSIRKEWKESIYGKVDITHLKGNRYLFSFSNAALAEKVIEDGPWTVMGHFLCLGHWISEVKLEMIHFGHIPIWVQVHGMMQSYMSRENAEIIGNGIGKFLEVDEKSLNPRSKRGYFRVKVLLDLYAVVRTGMWVISVDHGKRKHHVDYKYEKMADLCYRCGRFGHHMDDCEEEGVPHPQFGPWLKASEATSMLLAPMATVKGSRDKMDKQLKFKDDDCLLLGFTCLLSIVAVVVIAVVVGIYVSSHDGW